MGPYGVPPSMNIYLLIDPITKCNRYIGVAVDVRERYRKHCTRLAGNTYKVNWIKQLKSLDLKPIIEILEECDEFNWVRREQWWIAYGRFLGWPLTNLTDGGEGTLGREFSDETKRKIGESNKGNRKWAGRKHTEETKNRQREAKVGNTYAAKLSEEDIIIIDFLLQFGMSGLDIADIYNVDKHTICRINTGRAWSNITGRHRK